MKFALVLIGLVFASQLSVAASQKAAIVKIESFAKVDANLPGRHLFASGILLKSRGEYFVVTDSHAVIQESPYDQVERNQYTIGLQDGTELQARFFKAHYFKSLAALKIPANDFVSRHAIDVEEKTTVEYQDDELTPVELVGYPYSSPASHPPNRYVGFVANAKSARTTIDIDSLIELPVRSEYGMTGGGGFLKGEWWGMNAAQYQIIEMGAPTRIQSGAQKGENQIVSLLIPRERVVQWLKSLGENNNFPDLRVAPPGVEIEGGTTIQMAGLQFKEIDCEPNTVLIPFTDRQTDQALKSGERPGSGTGGMGGGIGGHGGGIGGHGGGIGGHGGGIGGHGGGIGGQDPAGQKSTVAEKLLASESKQCAIEVTAHRPSAQILWPSDASSLEKIRTTLGSEPKIYLVGVKRKDSILPIDNLRHLFKMLGKGFSPVFSSDIRKNIPFSEAPLEIFREDLAAQFKSGEWKKELSSAALGLLNETSYQVQNDTWWKLPVTEKLILVEGLLRQNISVRNEYLLRVILKDLVVTQTKIRHAHFILGKKPIDLIMAMDVPEKVWALSSSTNSVEIYRKMSSADRRLVFKVDLAASHSESYLLYDMLARGAVKGEKFLIDLDAVIPDKMMGYVKRWNKEVAAGTHKIFWDQARMGERMWTYYSVFYVSEPNNRLSEVAASLDNAASDVLITPDYD